MSANEPIYQTDTRIVSIDEVLNYFAKDFKLSRRDRKVDSVESFIDVAQGKIVFMITHVKKEP